MADPRRRDVHRRDDNIAVEVTAQGVELDLDVLEIADGEYAIHGRLAYEGEVIAATFASAEDAWRALDAIGDEWRSR